MQFFLENFITLTGHCNNDEIFLFFKINIFYFGEKIFFISFCQKMMNIFTIIKNGFSITIYIGFSIICFFRFFRIKFLHIRLPLFTLFLVCKTIVDSWFFFLAIFSHIYRPINNPINLIYHRLCFLLI